MRSHKLGLLMIDLFHFIDGFIMPALGIHTCIYRVGTVVVWNRFEDSRDGEVYKVKRILAIVI